MSRSRWSIAAAKAELSSVVRSAQREPQVLENRGEPVAVVVGIDEYRRTSERESAKSRWQAFLQRSDAMVAGGDAFNLEVPPRETRPDPLASPRARRKRR